MQKSTPIYCTNYHPIRITAVSCVLSYYDLYRNSEYYASKHQVYFFLDAILAIYNTPMNIYHCFVFGLINRVCEVLRQRISKRYSKRHFLYVYQSHPYIRQTARHGISNGKYMNFFLYRQNLFYLFSILALK